MIKQNKNPHQAIIFWLYFICGLVFAMVMIGAITRLTDSGLSIVEWRPLLGALPPMSDHEWNRVYALYKASPEFEKKHFWMDLHDFKQIFFWEWLHRFLGRFIGLAFALPLIFFAVTKRIPKGFGTTLIALFALGGAQGLMGWFMVQSGLIDNPYVSHFRLAAHLGLAFLIMVCLLYTALKLQNIVGCAASKGLYVHTWGVLGVVATTICWGAFTAGLDAGLLYNDEFPLMAGQVIPPDFHQYSSFWMNAIENPVGVQMVHRWLAMLSVIAVLSLYWRGLRAGIRHWSLHALMVMVGVQFTLGLATLLTHVHLHVAVTHQAGALCLLGLLVINMCRYKPLNNRRGID